MGGAYSHFKAFGLSPFPASRECCTEGLLPTCFRYAGENTVQYTVFMLIERMIQLPQENSIPGIFLYSIRTEVTVCNYFLWIQLVQ